MKNIVIGNDHGAIELKNRIVKHMESLGYSVKDMGVGESASVDYPDIAAKVCNEYLSSDYEFGMVLCGTGIGISIAANKIKGIRCALLHNNFTAQMAKEHNNANIISFGGRINYTDSPEEMINTFIKAEFLGGRHLNRVNKIMNLES